MRGLVVGGVAAVVLTAIGVAAGTVLLDDEAPAPPATKPFAVTPLEGFETTTLTVPRASFCSEVDTRQVEAALGSEPVDARGYDNGEDVDLADGVSDVLHEYGCVWAAADGSEARAWVFAPPVDAARAQRMADEAGRSRGCEPATTPAYGEPSVGLTCSGKDGARASYRGLFGDAWLTCELTSADPAADPAELRERAGAWCVGVALAASATAG